VREADHLRVLAPGEVNEPLDMLGGGFERHGR
jgi:hypothetical protein